MNTIIGQIEDTSGNPIGRTVTFVSISTPQFSGELCIANTTTVIYNDASDGTFSVQLEPGFYTVTYATLPNATTFTIGVPVGNSTLDISAVVVSSVSILPGAAPYLVWNQTVGLGGLTFIPLTDPGAPAVTPEIYSGGHQTSESFVYQIAWQTTSGNTVASSDSSLSVVNSPNNATRVTFPSPPSGVSTVAVYRSNDLTSNRYLLAVVPVASAYYDDWESNADFAARLDVDELAPVINTTAGQIFGSNVGFALVASITPQGMALWSPLFMLGTNARMMPGYGYQVFNSTTQLWHTLLCVGSPPQIAWDAGIAP